MRGRGLLTAATGVAALALLAVGSAATGEGAVSPPAAVDRLTLPEQVGQVIVLSFSGPTPPPYVLGALTERRVAGVILFGRNIASPAQLRSLTQALRRATRRPIVAVDQEGGPVRRVPWAGPQGPAPEQARAGTVRGDATKAARELRALGITVSLAPVADVPSVRGAALVERAFSSDPAVVTGAVRESVAGWRAGGVAATVKHFPGLGAAPANTDRAVVTIRRTREQLSRVDLEPFRAAIAAGVPLVMVGHARYPALDSSHVASQSRRIIEGLLREELAFRGVVVTDSLEARASLATGGIALASERALRAGADLLLLTGRGSYTPVYEHLLTAARRSPTLRARVREAAARVLRLRARGALPPA